MEKQGPGRPTGTIKNGETSHNQKLKTLKTKAWASSCHWYLSDKPGAKIGLGKTANAANAFASSPRNPVYSYKGESWSRWRSGKQGANKETVLDLWPDVQGVYFVGPWEDGTDPIGPPVSSQIFTNEYDFGGGFVPLWSALSNCGVIGSWRKVPKTTWKEWAPSISDECPNKDTDYIPGQLRNKIQLHQFACRLAQAKKKVPSLLALTAALTVAHINKDKKLWLFDPNPRENYSLPSSLRTSIIKSLAKINITLEEICDAAKGFGLTVVDCGAMSYQEFKSLRWPTSTHMMFETPKIEKFIESDYETVEIDENDWRDFFETPFQ